MAGRQRVTRRRQAPAHDLFSYSNYKLGERMLHYDVGDGDRRRQPLLETCPSGSMVLHKVALDS